jgi:hypothetical protein
MSPEPVVAGRRLATYIYGTCVGSELWMTLIIMQGKQIVCSMIRFSRASYDDRGTTGSRCGCSKIGCNLGQRKLVSICRYLRKKKADGNSNLPSCIDVSISTLLVLVPVRQMQVNVRSSSVQRWQLPE